MCRVDTLGQNNNYKDFHFQFVEWAQGGVRGGQAGDAGDGGAEGGDGEQGGQTAQERQVAARQGEELRREHRRGKEERSQVDQVRVDHEVGSAFGLFENISNMQVFWERLFHWIGT